MIKLFSKKLLSVLLAALFVVPAFAQITTSSLGGRIVDQSGAPLPGVAVLAVHTPSGTNYAAVTNNEGRYSIQGMRSGGPYTVEVSCLGFQTANYTGVTLALGETFNLNASMSEESLTLGEAVVIAAPTSKFAATEKTGASTNISNRDITEMPSVSRSISDVAKISPYGGNGMSLSGGDSRSTNFTVDGANFNNNFGLSSSLPGGGNPISIDAIEEVQVVVSPYDVRQTNFVGGGINAITKSGTNTFKGTVYGLYQSEKLHGNKVDGKKLAKPDSDKNKTFGVTFGGPIIKNKLFFFINAERLDHPGVVNRWRPSEDGVADADNYISRTTKEDMQKVADFVKSEYGYDAGSYSTYPGDETNTKILARIDWNITSKHHLALRYNYTLNQSWLSPNGNSMDNGPRMAHSRMSDYSMGFSNNMYSMDNKVNSFSFDLNSRFTNNLSNQLLVTYSKLDDVRGSNSSPFPHVDIMKDGDAYMSLGYELFSWNNGVHNDVVTAKDELTYFAGNHKITGGLSYEYMMADNAYMRGGTGYYRYASMDDFLQKKAPETVSVTYGYDGELNPAARVRYNKLGLYAQDEWSVNDRLKLVYGIRLDDILFDNADIMTNNAILALTWANGKHIDTGRWPKANIQVSPRIGFNYDVFGDKSLKVRGGTGIFSGRLPLVFFTNMPTNTGMVQNARAGYGKGAAELADVHFHPNVKDLVNELNGINSTKFPTTITSDDGVYSGAFDAIASDFKMPEVWKTSIAVDYTFPVGFPLTITGEFIYGKTLNGVYLQNWNVKDNSGWPTYNGADKRHIYPANYTVNKYDARVLSNTNKGYNYMADVVITTEPVKNLRITAGYTYTVSKELTGMPGSDASSAYQNIPSVDGPNFVGLHNSQYATPHRLFASINYNIKSVIGVDHFTLFYQGINGSNYSYVYKGDFNGDGVAEMDLMYIPKDDSEIRFATADDQLRYWTYANQDSYLSSHKGQYAEAYSVHAPMTHRFDFRYAHDFIVKAGNTKNTLQLAVDIMNVGNLLCSKWGYWSVGNRTITGSSYNIRPLTLDHVDTDGVPVFKTTFSEDISTWEKNKGFSSLWYMQIGIKYMFN